VEAIRGKAIAVKNYDEIRQVATIAANWDENLGNLVAEAMEKVGRTASSPSRRARERARIWIWSRACSLTRATSLPTSSRIRRRSTWNTRTVHPLLREEAQQSERVHSFPREVAYTGKPLVVVAEDVEGELLAALVINKLQGVLKVVAVKARDSGPQEESPRGHGHSHRWPVDLGGPRGSHWTTSRSTTSEGPRRSSSRRTGRRFRRVPARRAPSRTGSPSWTCRWSRPPRLTTRRS